MKSLSISDFNQVGIFQKRVVSQLNDGTELEDFETRSNIMFKVERTSTFEATMQESKNIRSDFKLYCNYTPDIDNGDRIIFNAGNLIRKNIYKQSEILRVNTVNSVNFSNKKTRRQYLKLNCSSGVFTNQATVQPTNELVVYWRMFFDGNSTDPRVLEYFTNRFTESIHPEGTATTSYDYQFETTNFSLTTKSREEYVIFRNSTPIRRFPILVTFDSDIVRVIATAVGTTRPWIFTQAGNDRPASYGTVRIWVNAHDFREILPGRSVIFRINFSDQPS